MLDAMAHRGPDDRGLYLHEKGVLGHNRLSIMDPARGKQPIYNEDGSKAVVANGEIYNFPDLYELLRHRHRFSTRNDSEVLVHLYEEHGSGMMHHIDGMYAFCIVDGEDAFLARDPLGIKPLYVGANREEALLFTSELKSLERQERVDEFPPGCSFHTGRGFHRFHDLPSREPEDLAPDHSARLVRDVLERSVRKRLMSDVPLGAFLSGGLDSSIIAAIAAEEMPDLHTFSVGLKDSSDLEAARAVSKSIGSRHFEYVLTPREVMRKLPEIIYFLESFDQDLVRSAVPCYFTARLASEYVKVILTGEGADELFGGYAYYKEIRDPRALNRELRRSVAALHNINLQRVDRLTMAHSIEGRVPFLDLEMIELAQRIPVQHKLHRDGRPAGAPIEKWILRRSFQDRLPQSITWRAKEQFDEGTGISRRLPGEIEGLFSDREAAEHRARYTGVALRSKEEIYYHRLFTEIFPNAEQILRNTGRWAQRPDPASGGLPEHFRGDGGVEASGASR